MGEFDPTPGPWKVTVQGITGSMIFVDGPAVEGVPGWEHRNRVARIETSGKDDVVNHANASLVAAAPGLRDLIREVIARLERLPGGPQSEFYSDWLSRAKKVIEPLGGTTA
jgi:hypothetical protein